MRNSFATWSLAAAAVGLLATLPAGGGPGAIETASPTLEYATVQAAPSDGAPSDGAPLDGITKSFVIVGYSTSYAWPDMLQDMLDEHAGADPDNDPHSRVYHVLNAVVGGSPVERWIAEPARERTFGAMKRDFFGDSPRLRPDDAPQPTIAICQQSLQLTSRPHGPVTSMHDKAGLKAGTDALETHATMLHDLALERVYIAMHIYKEGYEPEVGNERLALAELLNRGHDFIYEGPDVWSLTYSRHPEAFTEDRLHPNEMGMKIMAEAWYRVLADVHVKQSVIDNLWQRDYDTNTMMRDYLAWRRDG